MVLTRSGKRKLEAVTYYKLLPAKMENYGFRYRVGLNVDTKPFNKALCDNGLHFFTEQQLFGEGANFILLFHFDLKDMHLAKITLPHDARVITGREKCKADRIVIESLEPAWENARFCWAAMSCASITADMLRHVAKQTREMCLRAVRRNGNALQHVKLKQWPKLCMIAVRSRSFALRFVVRQTRKLCLAAVQKNGWSLRFVRKQTPEIVVAAVKKHPMAIEDVEERFHDIALEALMENDKEVANLLQ